ncbi:MAG: hypothetical protein C4539_13075 [Ignavibacteriales bacterium]|jgi:hypothetical protein|nr:MAG: hypothetical protein C4539_13075 [Ignavibacteriales bacterium]
MKKQFEDYVYRDANFHGEMKSKNIIKADSVNLLGKSIINIEEESHNGVKIILRKDENENIKEIKFVCSCGETKSVILDYSE